MKKFNLPKIKMPAKLTQAAGKASLTIRKHAPEILLVTGTVSIIAGGVAACKSTLKAKDTIDTYNGTLDTFRKLKESGSNDVDGTPYTENKYKKDIVKTYAEFGLELTKLYAPSLVLTGLGVASIFASNNIMRKRCASLSAAYVTLDSMFKRYRKNVIERFGEDVDQELRYGIKKETITIEETDEETGKKKKVKKEQAKIKDPNLAEFSDYARFWDDSCDGFYTDESGRPNTDCNLFYLKAREKEANIRLRAQGYLFLNDVYKMLGIKPSIAGQSVGWIYDKAREESDQDGDGFVSFNIYKATRANARFIEGIEDVILLDFNVDGPILEKLAGTLERI